MRIKKKMVSLVVAVSLVIGCLLGGTLAWLTDKTDTVTNTFTVGDVEITLTETPNADSDDNDTENDIWQAQMIPGNTYAKDPVVSVTGKTNVDCYLFVKFEEKNSASTYLTYTSLLTDAKGWTQGDGTDIPTNVWYRTVGKNDDVKTWNLLGGNEKFPEGCVTIKTSVTADNMEAAAKAELVYTAYATQKDNLTVKQAWDEVKN